MWKWRHDHVSQDMMDSYAQVLTDYGSSVAEAWGDFTAWNYAVGVPVHGRPGVSDGADYPVGGTVASFSTYPDSHSGTIDHLAANFIRCTGFGSEAGTVM